MKKLPSKLRSKPAVADENARAAADNITVKLDYLKAQIDAARRDPSLASVIHQALPKSRTQFNKWSSKGVPVGLKPPAFVSNAPKTLKNDAMACSAVDTAVAVVGRLRASILAAGKAPRSKLETVASLKREVQLLSSMKQIAERELLRYQSKAHDLEEQLLALKASHESSTREFKRAMDELHRRDEVPRSPPATRGDARVISLPTSVAGAQVGSTSTRGKDRPKGEQ